MTNLPTVRAGNWNDFSCFMAGAYLHEREATHFLWYFGNNTQGLSAEANDQAIAKDYADAIKAGDMETTRTGSGLRGVDIYGYLVRVVNPDGTPNAELIARVEKTIEELADYSILNDEIFSELENEQAFKNVSDVLKSVQLDWDIPLTSDTDGWNTLASEVLSWLYEHYDDSVSGNGYPEDEEVIEALEALGYEKYPDYPAGADCNEGVPA